MGGTGKTVVIVFDTVETIRGMYLLLTLTQWMKALPATLFILSGGVAGEQGEQADPISQELEDPYQGSRRRPSASGTFTERSARDYLATSRTGSGLTPEELDKAGPAEPGAPALAGVHDRLPQTRACPRRRQLVADQSSGRSPTRAR